MNWFGFAPGRGGLLVDSDRNEGFGTAVDVEVVRAGERDGPRAEPGPSSDVTVSGDVSVAALRALLATDGALPAGLAARLEQALREVAARHPGTLRVVEAVASGGAHGGAVVVIVERQGATEPGADEVARRFGLTHRQATVALLLARRHSNAEIARMLDVSPHTARHHTERVLEKLGVSSRMKVASLVLDAH